MMIIHLYNIQVKFIGKLEILHEETDLITEDALMISTIFEKIKEQVLHK